MEVLLATKSNQDLVSLMDGSWNMLFHHVSLQSWASSGGKSVALVLGKALLWKVFDDKNNFVVPSFILQHVKGAYRDHIGVRCTLQEGDNTVEKVPLTVYKSGGNEAQVIIEIVFKFDTAGGEEGAGGGQMQNTHRSSSHKHQGMQEENRFLNSQICSCDEKGND